MYRQAATPAPLPPRTTSHQPTPPIPPRPVSAYQASPAPDVGQIFSSTARLPPPVPVPPVPERPKSAYAAPGTGWYAQPGPGDIVPALGDGRPHAHSVSSMCAAPPRRGWGGLQGLGTGEPVGGAQSGWGVATTTATMPPSGGGIPSNSSTTHTSMHRSNSLDVSPVLYHSITVRAISW